MKRKYENLILALSKFAEDWWLPYKDSYNMLDLAIKNGMINKHELLCDFSMVMNDNDTHFIDLANQSQLLIAPEKYSNEDIKNYVKFLLQDYLFPEKAMTDEEIENLTFATENILKNSKSNDGWVLAYDVFKELKKRDDLKYLEYYNLWKLPFAQKRISQRYVENREREIGYLKYNEQSPQI